MANHRIPRQRAKKRRFWLDFIRDHAASGLSVEAWCQQNQISSSAFYRWKMQLQGQSHCDNSKQPRFVEALVQNNTITELVGSNANLLIHFGQARIEVPAGFDSETIRVVLETLQGGPC